MLEIHFISPWAFTYSNLTVQTLFIYLFYIYYIHYIYIYIYLYTLYISLYIDIYIIYRSFFHSLGSCFVSAKSKSLCYCNENRQTFVNVANFNIKEVVHFFLFFFLDPENGTKWEAGAGFQRQE